MLLRIFRNALLVVFVLAVADAFAQNDSTKVKVYNESPKDIYIAFAYQLVQDNETNHYAIGWYKIDQGDSITVDMLIKKRTPIRYHAHSVLSKEDNWGGDQPFMGHPTAFFWIKEANNAVNAHSYDKGLSAEEELELEAYPSRAILFNREENCFMLILR